MAEGNEPKRKNKAGADISSFYKRPDYRSFALCSHARILA